MAKKIKSFVIELILIFVVTFVAGLILSGLISNKFQSFGVSKNIFDPYAWLIGGSSSLLYLLTNLDKVGGNKKKDKKKDPEPTTQSPDDKKKKNDGDKKKKSE